MQAWFTHLSTEEREEMCPPESMSLLWSAWTSSGHTTWNSTAVNHPLYSSSNVELPVDTLALIDWGAAGNFSDAEFAKFQDIALITCDSLLAVAALDEHTLGSSNFTSPLRQSVYSSFSHLRTLWFLYFPGYKCIISKFHGLRNR